MEILCNLHSHTTFCDGEHTPEEMVLSALEKGCRTLGFSGHAPSGVKNDYGYLMDVAAYRNEVNRLKSAYAGRLEILLGIEQDYFSPRLTHSYDYVIGSVHYVKVGDSFIPMDISYDELKKGIDRNFSSDPYEMARKYYETVADIFNVTNCQIVGHFDIVTKYNEKYGYLDESAPRYVDAAFSALDYLIEKDLLIEINTGAMSRGWKSAPYPSDRLIKRVAEKKGRLILASDCHHKDNIFSYFNETVERVRALGVKELWIYENGMPVPVAI